MEAFVQTGHGAIRQAAAPFKKLRSAPMEAEF